MKNVLLVVVGFCLGYLFSSQFIHQADESLVSEAREVSSTTDMQQPLQAQQQASMVNNAADSLASNTGYQTDVVEPTGAVDSQQPPSKNPDKPITVPHQPEPKTTDQHTQILKQTLQDNGIQHWQPKLDIISQDNPMLSKRDPQYQAAEDESWAYVMERDIQSAIAQHENADSFVVHNITCKQRLCDVLGLELAEGIWMKIYISLIQALPNVVPPNSNSGLRQVRFSEPGGNLIYGQLAFSK